MNKSFKQSLRIFWEIAISDFKLRYNNSILGYLWTLIKPLMLFGILYVVFSFFMRFEIDNYALHLLVGVVFWNFFVEATTITMHSFINKAALITKIYFPRHLIVLAATMTSLLTLLLNSIIVFVFVIYSAVDLSWAILIFPLLLIVYYFLVLGISFILSILYVKFRDLQHIWEVLLQIGFWLTPVIYTVSIIPEKYRFYVLLNPVARIIDSFRKILILNELPTFLDTAILIGVTALIFLLGLFIFKRKQAYIAENI